MYAAFLQPKKAGEIMQIQEGFSFPTSFGQGITLTGKPTEICYASKESCRIEAPVRFCSNVKIDSQKIGAFSFFNQNCSLRFLESIGRFGLFAAGVIAGGGVHPVEAISTHLLFQNMDNSWNENFHSLGDTPEYYRQLARYQREHEFAKKTRIVIGNDVWVGNRAILLRGITIGNGAVIGAGAVVTKDVEPYTIVGGVPAKPIRKRFSSQVIEALERLQWWKYGPDVMKGIDLNHPEEGVKHLEERIVNGFPVYCPQTFRFEPERNQIFKEDSREDILLYQY